MQEVNGVKPWLNPSVTGLVLAGIGIALVLVSAIWSDEAPSLDNLSAIGAGAVVLGLMFPYVKKLKLPGGIEAELREIKRGLTVNTERISLLSLLAVSPQAFNHLRNLQKGGEATGVYEVKPWVKVELEHLRNVGYIEPVRDDKGVRDIPEDKPVSLSDYVRLTRLGAAYVKLREETEAQLEPESLFGAVTPQ